MKEKIKKIFFKIAEIGTVVWAINEMWGVIALFNISMQDFVNRYPNKVYFTALQGGVNLFLVHLLFYFLSAVLILYLLRKYERKN